MYHELYEHYVLPYNSLPLENFNTELNWSLSFFISFCIQTVLYWFYECGHFIIIFIIQYSVFSLMLFSLISFLYLQKSCTNMELAYSKHKIRYSKKE
jgi:hypothetical protein